MRSDPLSLLVVSVLRALVEGLAVAIAAVFIAKHALPMKEVFTLALTAGVVFFVLDLKVMPPVYASAARTGAGFGLGANLVGFPGGRV
jgi:hypothetical protein